MNQIDTEIEDLVKRFGRGQGKSYISQYIACWQIACDVYKYGKGSITMYLDPDADTTPRQKDFIHQVKERMESMFTDIKIDQNKGTVFDPVWVFCKDKEKLWYWEYKTTDDEWVFCTFRLTEKEAKDSLSNYKEYRKIEELGYIEKE